MAFKRETITIKLTAGKDDVLIRWWQSLPKGDYKTDGRQGVIKNVLLRGLDLPEQLPPAAPGVDNALITLLEKAITELQQQFEGQRHLNAQQQVQLQKLQEENGQQQQWIEYLDQNRGQQVYSDDAEAIPLPDEPEREVKRVDGDKLEWREKRMKQHAKW